jgi:hypothetical protein
MAWQADRRPRQPESVETDPTEARQTLHNPLRFSHTPQQS